MKWKLYKGKAVGIEVRGDEKMLPTRWWNWWWLTWFGWNTIVILARQDQGVLDMYIGYRPFKGPARVSTEPVSQTVVAVRIGHEDCTFFAVDEEGNEIPLKTTERARRI